MSRDPQDIDTWLDDAVRVLAAAESARLVEHLDPETLVNYRLGHLPAEEEAAVLHHLGLCRECTQRMLDLAELAKPPEEAAPVAPLPPLVLRRQWQRVQALSGRASAAPSRRWTWMLAAALAAAVGLGVWNVALQHQLAELRRPRADVAYASLAPEAQGAARSVEAPVRLPLLPGVGRLLLLLNLGALADASPYRLELVDPDRGAGREILWAAAPVRRGEDGIFLLEIPADLLAAKVYRVRLLGEPGGRREVLAVYSFEVVRGPARLP